MDSCNNLVQGDEMCHNIEISYMDFVYDAYVQSYPDTMHISPVQAPQVDSTNISLFETNITLTVGGDNVVVEPEDDDPDGGENVSYENTCK